MINSFSSRLCRVEADDTLRDRMEIRSINSEYDRYKVSQSERDHFVDKSVVVPSVFPSSKNNLEGAFVPLVDRNVAQLGTVECLFCRKREGVDAPKPDDASLDVGDKDDIWLLKSAHSAALVTKIKRMFQRLFYLLLSQCYSGEKSKGYLQKSLYFNCRASLYFREEAGARVMNLVLGKFPCGAREVENWYQSRVYCETLALDGLCFPVLAVKDVSPCEMVNIKKLKERISSDVFSDGTSASARPRECFKFVGDPALLYFLRILLLGDEDCLKSDNYLLKRGEEENPAMVGIDFGMAFYQNGGRFKSSESKEQLLERIMRKSWKHCLQYGVTQTMIELLKKMEASDPGYLNEKLDDALKLINACTEEELNECLDRVPDTIVSGTGESERTRLKKSLLWRKGLVSKLLSTSSLCSVDHARPLYLSRY